MAGVGRDLYGSRSPTPLPKQGHLQQAAQDLVQAGLEYLQIRRLHNLPHLRYKKLKDINFFPVILKTIETVLKQYYKISTETWN